MARVSKKNNLLVYFQKNLVGFLRRELNGAIEFEYADEWIKNGYPISLSLPLNKTIYKGEVAAYYFDNLLPDNKLILENIAQKFGAKSIKQIDILTTIGKECVGALSFHQESEDVIFDEKIKVRMLKDSDIAKKIKGLSKDTPLGMDEGEFRISLAGAQEKMALLNWNGKWCEPLGATATSHIIKKSIGTLLGEIDFSESVENEHVCLELARYFEIKTCVSEVKQFEDEKVLVIKRFDRYWKDKFIYRVTQEDLCQAMGKSPQEKYERLGGASIKDIMDLLKTSNNARTDRYNAFKLFIFNDLIFNTDGHAKNISIYLNEKGFALTPFYDLLSAHFLIEQDKKRYEKLRSSLSVNEKFIYKDIKLEDWRAEARKCGLSVEDFEQIVDDLKTKIDLIDDFKINNSIVSCENSMKVIINGLKRRSKQLGIG